MELDALGLPEEGHEDKLAFRLLSSENPLELRVLHLLAGKPRRFRDFKVLLEAGKSDTPVTRALLRLTRDGLVDKGLTSDPSDQDYRYGLSGLGLHVLLRTHEFRPVNTVFHEMMQSRVFSA